MYRYLIYTSLLHTYPIILVAQFMVREAHTSRPLIHQLVSFLSFFFHTCRPGAHQRGS